MMENGSKTIIKSGIFVGSVLLFAKVIGFIKQMIIAWIFGANINTDLYFIADGFVGPLTVVVFSSISIVLLSEYVYEKNKEDKDTLISNMYVLFFIIAIVMVLILIVAAPWITKVIAIGYSQEHMQQVTEYIRCFSVILLFYCFMSIGGAVLEGEKIFVPTKLQSIFVSGGVIIFAILFHNKVGVYSILFGVIAGYFFHGLYVTVCARKHISFRLRNPFSDIRVWKVVKLSVPLLLGNAIVDVNMIIDKMIASGLGEGSISALYYGQVVSNDLVSAVFVTSLGTIFLSHFATYASEGNDEEIGKLIGKGCICLIMILTQVTILYVFSSYNIVEFLFHHGSFTTTDVNNTSVVVLGCALGYVPMAVREIFVKAHYAYQDTKNPMINGIIGAIFNAIISYILAKKMGTIGIALGTSISYVFIAGLSIVTFKKHNSVNYSFILKSVKKMAVAGVCSTLVFVLFRYFFVLENLVVWIACCFISTLIYIVVLKALKCEEIDTLIGILYKRRKKGN